MVTTYHVELEDRGFELSLKTEYLGMDKMNLFVKLFKEFLLIASTMQSNVSVHIP